MHLRQTLAMIRGFRYEIIALIEGAVVMSLELVGARMIAPYFGSSIYVWTAVIGVILGAMAIGYWQGGRLADRFASDQALVVIITIAATIMFICLMAQPIILPFTQSLAGGIRIRALLAALLLFAPINFVLGMLSPFLVKLRVTSLERSGSSVGRLSAAGTVGSIIGTFATGYWLFAWLGNRSLGLTLVLILVLASLLAPYSGYVWWRGLLCATVLTTLVWTALNPLLASQPDLQVVYDGDSAYARYQVVETSVDNRPARLLITDNQGAQSGVFTDNPEDATFGYIRTFLAVAAARSSDLHRILVIGGGTYTFPRQLIHQFPNISVDVVEIDPALDAIARKYFDFRADPRIHVIHQDGRTFLNANTKTYDLVYMDAFTSLSPPPQLTTVQAGQQLRQALTANGLLAVNLVAAPKGPNSKFLSAEAHSYGQSLPLQQLIVVNPAADSRYRQNLVLLCAKSEQGLPTLSSGSQAHPLKQEANAQLLTDDFSPVEALTQR